MVSSNKNQNTYLKDSLYSRKRAIHIFELIKKYGWKKYRVYKRYYYKKLKGEYIDDYISQSCCYFPDDIGSIEEIKMQSGKTGLFKIINVNKLDNYGSKNIQKDFIGYKEIKPIRKCTLEEFIQLYPNYLKID
jgi:hypothetical protein